jgi:predicted nucleic acid-binding Zn ribbon protein
MSMSSKKNDFQSVGQAIREMLNTYRITNKYDEASIIDSWERLVGKPIASRTKKIFIKNKVLFVEFDSPTMRHDFTLHKSEVLEVFRKEFGDGVITEIIAM